MTCAAGYKSAAHFLLLIKYKRNSDIGQIFSLYDNAIKEQGGIQHEHSGRTDRHHYRCCYWPADLWRYASKCFVA